MRSTFELCRSAVAVQLIHQAIKLLLEEGDA